MTLVTLEVSNNVSERMLLHFYVNLATLSLAFNNTGGFPLLIYIIHKGDKAYYQIWKKLNISNEMQYVILEGCLTSVSLALNNCWRSPFLLRMYYIGMHYLYSYYLYYIIYIIYIRKGDKAYYQSILLEYYHIIRPSISGNT